MYPQGVVCLSLVDEMTKKKWVSLGTFLIIDGLQILFVSFITLDESTPWIIGFDPSRSNPLTSLTLFVGITIAQLSLLYYVSLRTISGANMQRIFPNYDDSGLWRCKYLKDDLVRWSMEIADKSSVKIDRILVMQSPLPNAFTFSLPLIGSVLVIYSNIMDLLNENEVKAIIAHEIGHIKNKDSLTSIFSQMPAFFIDVIYIYIYARLGLGIATALLVNFDIITATIRILVLIGFFILSRVMVFLTRLLVQSAVRKAEMLADHHAAVIIGLESSMNALIRLGQRVEAVTALVDTIRWLESLNPERVTPVTQEELGRMILSFPLDGIDEKNAEQMAPWVFLYTKLKHLREVYGVELTDEQITEAITPAVRSLSQQRSENKTDESARRVVDWRTADVDGDDRLSPDELSSLITMLRANPTKLMFDSEVGKKLLLLDHPDFRSRILFIADTFGM